MVAKTSLKLFSLLATIIMLVFPVKAEDAPPIYNVKGGTHESVTFLKLETHYLMIGHPAANWVFKSAAITGSSHWMAEYSEGARYSKAEATVKITEAPELFPSTLYGTIIPVGPGSGPPPPTDYSIKANGEISFHITAVSPTDDDDDRKIVIAYGSDATFEAVVGDSSTRWKLVKTGGGNGNIPTDLVTGARRSDLQNRIILGAIGKDGKTPIAPGEYTVSADKNGDWKGTDQDSMKLVILGISILGDTNRDGKIEENDEKDKASWTKDHGAIIYYGQGKDDKKYNLDDPSIATFIVKKCPVVADEGKLYLKCTVSDKIAIFKLGDTTPISFSGGKWEFPGDIATGDMIFKIISLVPTSPTFIKFNLTLTLERNGKITNDAIAIRVTPIILPWNGDNVEKIYVSLNIPGIPNTMLVNSNTRWAQDVMELGASPITQDGSKTGHILIDLLHPGGINFIIDLQKNNKLWQRLECNNEGNGGDIEVMQPDNANYYGKIYYGSETFKFPNTIKLLKDQGMQSLSKFDTSWLLVGHVDEVMSFVGGKKVFVPSPRKAFDLMHNQIITGNGNETIKTSTSSGTVPMASETKTFTEICIDPANSFNLYTLETFFPSGLLKSSANISFTSAESVFPEKSFLRVDDEILYVRTVVKNKKTGEYKTTIQRGTNTGIGVDYIVPSTLSAHAPSAKMYVISNSMLANISTKTNHATGIIKRKFLQYLYGYTLVEMPVLFGKTDGLWYAATSNIVNSLVVDGSVYYPDPFNPTFDTYIKASGGTTAVDVWNNFHLYEGELHCGTNAFRKLSDNKWWNHIK
ncbi:MAG: protein-arginine deiminase family protein [Victivallales bacterium]